MRTLPAVLASFALLQSAPVSADTLHEALEAYALYQHDVGVLIDLDVNSAESINGALARLSRHDGDRVSRGFIAYGALTAAQSPAFATGVQNLIRTNGRRQTLDQLRADVTYARRQTNGAPQAIRLVLDAAGADSARVNRAGSRYDDIARTSQAPWIASSARRVGVIQASARLTPDMRQRLQIGALSARPMNDADAFGGRGFWDALAGRDAHPPRSRNPREDRSYTDVTNRMLTLAALVVADAQGAERTRVADLLEEPLTQQCMEMQRLQLRQCLSVSHDASERAYCLGRHGLSGPGACFSAMVR